MQDRGPSEPRVCRGRLKLVSAAVVAVALGAMSLSAPFGSSSGAAVKTSSSGVPSNIKATLTVWTYLLGQASESTEFQAEDALFKAQFPNVTLDVTQIPAATEDAKLLTAAAAHTGPDVVQDNPNVDSYELGASGAIANMTPYWDAWAQKGEFPTSALWMYKGKIVTAQSYVNVLGVWYNETLLSSLGLKPATTISALEAQLPIIKAHGYVGLMLDSAPGLANATWQMYPWIAAQGGNWCSFGGGGSKAALTLLSNWQKSGYISASSPTWDNQDITTSGFYNGYMAYLEDGNWAEGALPAAHLKFKVGSGQVFAGPAGSHVLPGGEGFAIGGFSTQKQLAFDYIADSWLSEKGGVISYKAEGYIPTRADIAPLLKSVSWIKPFLSAVKSEVPWPSDSQANKAETDVSDVLSGIMSGAISASTGASQAAQVLKTDFASGTGSCHGG